MKNFLIISFLAVLSVSCENKTSTKEQAGWSKSDEARFMRECETTAGKSVEAAFANEYCDCMLQKLKKKYGNYQEANREFSDAEDEILTLAKECAGQ